MKNHADVVVIGGGIAGSSTAYFLRRAGVDVTLVEREDIACGATSRNGGGFRQSARDVTEIPLAVASIEMAPKLWEELGEDVEHVRQGNLRLAESEEELQVMAASVPRQQQAGLKAIRPVSRQEALEIAPVLNPERVFGGTFCSTDGHINPMRACFALANGARRLGAEVLLRTAVTGIEVERGRVAAIRTTAGRIVTRTVINAAGAGAIAVAALAGLQMPGQALTFQGMITERIPPIFPVMFGVGSASIYWRQTVSGNVLFGGRPPGARRDVGGSGTAIRRTPIAPVSTHMLQLVPALQGVRMLRLWTGQDLIMPDNMPMIGPTPEREGFLYATGYSGHGMPMGPITGKLLAELVTTGKTSLPLTGLEASRFARQQT